jgi:hypothetical protein
MGGLVTRIPLLDVNHRARFHNCSQLAKGMRLSPTREPLVLARDLFLGSLRTAPPNRACGVGHLLSYFCRHVAHWKRAGWPAAMVVQG